MFNIIKYVNCSLLLLFLDTCGESEFFLLPFCYTECPKYFYVANDTSSDAVRRHTAMCLRCHSTCVLCSGPAADNCLNCSMHRRLTDDHRCIDVDSEGRGYSLLVIAAIATVPVAVIGIAGVSIWLWLRQRRSSYRSTPQLFTCIIYLHLSGYYSCNSTSIRLQFDYDLTTTIAIKIAIRLRFDSSKWAS